MDIDTLVGLRVQVPASTANLGAGFDSLGAALGLYLEVEVLERGGGPRMYVAGQGAGELPKDDTNLIWSTLVATYKELGGEDSLDQLALGADNAIPLARGLGSSSAALVAAIVLAGHLVGVDDRDQLLQIAARHEGHPDNVAAALYGGLVIAAPGEASVGQSSDYRVHRLAPATSRALTVFVPEHRQPTDEARGRVPDSLSTPDVALQAARAAGAVAVLTGAVPISPEVFVDRLHEPPRCAADALVGEALAALRGTGHAAWLSGAGPSIAALNVADTVAIEGFERRDLVWDTRGARVTPAA